MRCYVCARETRPRQRYCDRCRPFFIGKDELLKRRAALRGAYDREHDGFRCHWSGVLLEEKDIDDPFHLSFDHLLPVRRSVLVASSEVLNKLKGEFTPAEFPRAIRELAAHNAGQPFDRDAVKFSCWGVRAPSPSGAVPPRNLTKVHADECVICGAPPMRWAYYCARCRRFVRGRHQEMGMHAKALKRAWDAERGGFACHYTGVIVNETDTRSPWYLTFDHRVPGVRGTMVVASMWVNRMKNALSEDEFRKLVVEYDRYLREGGEFDRDVVEFAYWRKVRRAQRKARGHGARARVHED